MNTNFSQVIKLKFFIHTSSKKLDWEFKGDYTAAYSIQGHRANQEDRFVIHDIDNTGVSLFAVFDGHGGQVRILKIY